MSRNSLKFKNGTEVEEKFIFAYANAVAEIEILLEDFRNGCRAISEAACLNPEQIDYLDRCGKTLSMFLACLHNKKSVPADAHGYWEVLHGRMSDVYPDMDLKYFIRVLLGCNQVMKLLDKYDKILLLDETHEKPAGERLMKEKLLSRKRDALEGLRKCVTNIRRYVVCDESVGEESLASLPPCWKTEFAAFEAALNVAKEKARRVRLEVENFSEEKDEVELAKKAQKAVDDYYQHPGVKEILNGYFHGYDLFSYTEEEFEEALYGGGYESTLVTDFTIFKHMLDEYEKEVLGGSTKYASSSDPIGMAISYLPSEMLEYFRFDSFFEIDMFSKLQGY